MIEVETVVKRSRKGAQGLWKREELILWSELRDHLVEEECDLDAQCPFSVQSRRPFYCPRVKTSKLFLLLH